jgi:hypothetical protein
MSKKIMIKCDEATSICNKNQYCEASFFDKFRLGIHNFLCKKCRLYSEQNSFMTKLFKVHFHKSKEAAQLCEEDKKEMAKQLQKEISSKTD